MKGSSKVDLNDVISGVLKYGLIVSSAVVLVGIILLPTVESSPSFPQSVGQLIQGRYASPTLQMAGLAQGVASLDPLYVLQLGLLILLATPVIRVAASVLAFAAAKDGLYVAITATVLAILLLSIFVVGQYVTPA